MLTADLTTIPRPDTPMVVLSPLGVVDGASVTIPWLDSRTATIPPISMEDPRIAPLFDRVAWRDRTLAIALRMRYVVPGLGKQIAFWGPVHAPDIDYETGLVGITAHDPSLRMKAAFATDGDSVLDGYTLDGRGAQAIVDSAQNRPNQDDLNWPSLGINVGVDLATDAPGTDRKATRGDQLWRTLTDLAGIEIGPDFELEPFESSAANVATGPVTDNADHAIPNGTTEYDLNVGLAGVIEGFRLGLYITHGHPSDLFIALRHPDGTQVTIYDGNKDTSVDNPGGAFGDAFGTGDGALAFFADFGDPLYGAKAGPWPKTGRLRSDKSLMSAFADKPAVGMWKLFITNGPAWGGTLKAWSLRFRLPDPAYCRINTWDKPPDNPEADAKFYDGHGPDNAKIKVTPLGEATHNWFLAASKSNADGIIRQNSTARDEIGNYQGWESTGEEDSDDVLAAYADREVKAYARPLPALTVKPDDDYGQANLPRLLWDYKVGGHLLASAKRGYARHRIVCRVRNGVLTNAGGRVRTDLNVVPTVGMSGELGDG